MTPEAILEELKMSGVQVEAVGDKLRCRAPVGVLTPELRQTLLEHKPALLRLLATPAPNEPSAQDDHGDDHLEPPCPRCGAADWRDTPDGGRWCVPCVAAGREPVAAVNVWSEALGEAVWVVADDLPREAWPTDAPVYTQAEVKILTTMGPDTLAWVHATKTMFGAKVVDGKRRLTPNPASPGEAPEQE